MGITSTASSTQALSWVFGSRAAVIPTVPFSTRASLAGHGKTALVTAVPAPCAGASLSLCPQAAEEARLLPGTQKMLVIA